MRVLLFSKRNVQELRDVLKEKGVQLVKSKPDIIICYGGDGTFLLAEHQYPGIPKLLVRKDSVCAKCYDLSPSNIAALLAKRLRITEHIKLSAVILRGKRRIKLPPAVNNIIIRSVNPLRALRFSVEVDKNEIGDIIGDGVVIATPFGSTGYYHSITREEFTKGIGIALNNSVQRYPGLLCSEDVRIEILIQRHAAHVGGDTTTVIAKPGDRIIITRSTESARTVLL